MSVKFKIKKNDKVIILSGKDKGKAGDVIKVLTKRKKLLISGINTVKKHTKATEGSQGGIVQKEMPIDISNVSLLCPKTNKPTKVGYKFLEDGKKVRFARKSGEIIDI